ncbi:MAG: cyclic nucleotide-binding domain-containing protein [Desulfosarcinaceae bacterium]|nr:cyclic nucleotide-binding domain-containing protein [Desulfosarcinaceae bacterium]
MKQSEYLMGDRNLFVDLKKLPVFEPLDQADLDHLLRMSRLRIYKSGEVIIQEGSVDNWIYFLIYGKVRIVKQDKEISILNRGGDLFGEMRFIENAPRSASAYADGDTVCLALDTGYLTQLSGEDKLSFGYILYRILAGILAEKLREATQELMAVKGTCNISLWSDY